MTAITEDAVGQRIDGGAGPGDAERVESVSRSDAQRGPRGDVRLAAAGDAAAFERLYRAHAARIHTLVRRMVHAEDADDLTQEIFIRAWQKLETFRGESEFGTWLHRLAINHCLSRRTAFARLRARFPIIDAPVTSRAAEPRPDARMDIERAMAELPPGARQVFVLHDVEGYKHHEIAELMGISVGTSKSQLHRARMELRSALS